MFFSIIKKAKEFFSWFSFIYNILGWLGLASVISSLAVATAGVVGAMTQGIPWPFILMAGYCTLVGGIYLAMAPMAFRALMSASQPKENIGTNQPMFIRPNYEAWKHVEKFTLREAAHLWNDLEPNVSRNYTTEVDSWIKAFCAAIRKGELEFIHTNSRRLDIIKYENENPNW